MTKQRNNSLAGLVSFIFVFLLIAVSVWTVSPVDDVKAAPETWTVIDPMTTAREYHTATLLLDFTATAFYQGTYQKVKLSDYRGKWVVLCFYPGDFTFV